MPKILKPVRELENKGALSSDRDVPYGNRRMDVEQVPAFPEPDHAPEIAATARYEAIRDGHPLAGIEEVYPTPEERAAWDRPAVSLRGVTGEPEDAGETQERPEETSMTRDPDRRGWDRPMLSSEIDHDHDCAYPDHQVWSAQWWVDHGWPPARDYFTCRGFRRLRARSISELRPS